MYKNEHWQVKRPPGWPADIEAEQEYGLVSIRPDPARPGRREWLAGPCWVRAADDTAAEIANARAPNRSVRIARGTTLDVARQLLAGIGVFTTRSRLGLRELAEWLATAPPTANPWAPITSYGEKRS